MKQIGIYTASLMVLLSACNSNEKESKNTTATATPQEVSTVTTFSTKTGLSEDVDARVKELEKLTPLTLDQLKALLPAAINGMPKSDFNGTSNAKLAFAYAKYIKDEKHQLRIGIQDCANVGGKEIFRAQYAMVANAGFATENEQGYFKAIDFMGGKATEAYNKKNNKADLTYIAKDRLLITLSGQGMTPEEVKQIAQNLTFDLQ